MTLLEILVLIIIFTLTTMHRSLLLFRDEGKLELVTAFDIFSMIMHLTIFINLIIMFHWIGLGIATLWFFIGGLVTSPLGLLILKVIKYDSKLLLAIFSILSWINIAVTVINIIKFVFY